MFTAHKGSGAYLNNSRIRVSNKSDFKNSLIVTGGPRAASKIKDSVFKEFEKVSMKIRPPIRKSGSAALDLAYVAAGRYDGSWQRELNYWDVAAGIILIKESIFFSDGTLKEIRNYKNNQKHGDWTIYYKNKDATNKERKKQSYYYNNGKLTE